MNASIIINFFKKKKIIKFKRKEIIDICNSIGSDVLLGLYSKNLILKPNSMIKKLSVKKKFYTLIVKPNFGCSSKRIYSKVKKFTKSKFYFNSNIVLKVEFLKKMKNDLEKIAFNEYPKLKILKKKLLTKLYL